MVPAQAYDRLASLRVGASFFGSAVQKKKETLMRGGGKQGIVKESLPPFGQWWFQIEKTKELY